MSIPSGNVSQKWEVKFTLWGKLRRLLALTWMSPLLRSGTQGPSGSCGISIGSPTNSTKTDWFLPPGMTADPWQGRQGRRQAGWWPNRREPLIFCGQSFHEALIAPHFALIKEEIKGLPVLSDHGPYWRISHCQTLWPLSCSTPYIKTHIHPLGFCLSTTSCILAIQNESLWSARSLDTLLLNHIYYIVSPHWGKSLWHLSKYFSVNVVFRKGSALWAVLEAEWGGSQRCRHK